MRIIRARQLVEMLAPWRKTAGWADWNVTNRYPDFGPEARDEQARLENGHTLNIGSGQWGSNRPSDMYFDYHITDPSDQIIASGGWEEGPNHQNPTIRSADEAKAAAEEHYQRLFPIGTDTGSHDSGVDYDDIIRNHKDYL